MTFGLSGVDVDFGGDAALSGITLDVRPGSVTAVVGGDGAGKSTLLRCLVGLVAPTRGTVSRPPKRRTGYMAATSGTWRDLTVGENVDFIARSYGVGRDAVAERGRSLLERAGLDHVVDRTVGHLSGGMRQKLGFCLAVLHEPELLVLDEPSTGVDVVSRVQLWQLIAGAAAGGAAVLMATTYLDEAERATEVLVLDRGQRLAGGEPGKVIAGLPGSIVEVAAPTDPGRSWRRGGAFHEWRPDGAGGPGRAVEPDLEDVVIAEMLGRRREAAGP